MDTDKAFISDEQCQCGLMKIYIIIPSIGSSEHVTVKVCASCDLPTEEIEPWWKLP